MITDDQVADLLRDAGNDGPLPRPLDPAVAVSRARRSRTRTQGLVGLAAVLGLIAAVEAPTRSVLDQALGAGSSTVPAEQHWWAALMPVWALLLVLVVAGLATPVALRLPEAERRRTLLAATWGVLSLVVLGVLGSWLAAFLVTPDTLVDNLRVTPRAAAILGWSAGLGLVSFVLCWIALLARRALRPAALPPFRGALWVILAVEAGYWVSIVALAPGLGSRFTPSLAGVAAFGVLVLVALAVGTWCSRGRFGPRTLRRVGGVTLLVAGSACLSAVGLEALQVLPRALTEGRAAGAVALVVLVAISLTVSLAGAVLALPPGARPWAGRLLAVLATAAPLAAGSLLFQSLTGSRPVGALSAVSERMVVVLLVAAAVSALGALDRRPARATGHDAAD